jgi:putative ABC transport system permease protein
MFESDAEPEVYLLGEGRELVVRTHGTIQALIPAVRATLRELDPGMAADEFQPLTRIVDRAVSPKRLITLLLGLFSLLALLLAAVGVYGVTAYSVSRRTREIGIRLALGSSRATVLRLIIGEEMKVVLLGCAIGILASLALTRLIQTLLFAVSPTDPPTFAVTGLMLMAVALLACWLPARRAARVDPMVALRNE